MKAKIKLLCALSVILMLSSSFVSLANEVIDGKDGWYFYSADGMLSNYSGTDIYTNAQLEMFRQRLLKTQDALKEKGIEFVLYLAPNKEHIYSEYMPDSYGELASYTSIEQLYDYLKDDLRVICPIDDLIDAKQKWPQYDLYYRTGTHWNDAGIYIASKPLLSELGIMMPDFGTLTVGSVPIEGLELGQLSDRQLYDNRLILSGYTSRPVTLEGDGVREIHYHTQGADPRKVLIYGESFALSLANGLSSQFDDVHCVFRGNEVPGMVDREHPDIVIYEVLERYLDMLPAYPMIP